MRTFARVISEVFSPFVLAGVLIALIAWATDPRPLLPSLVSLGFIVLVPQLLSIEMVRRGKTTDRFIQVRTQRTSFYLLTLVSMLLGALFINLMPTSHEVKLVLNLSVATLVLVILVNLKLKVSIHALLAALFAVVAPLYLWASVLWWVLGFLMWATTVWSRLTLKRHSAIELVVGTIFGLILAAVYIYLR